ncbi:hypothetical protein TNCT_371671, partial [Trichonephila clavata]
RCHINSSFTGRKGGIENLDDCRNPT